jgi:hypothetical protein
MAFTIFTIKFVILAFHISKSFSLWCKTKEFEAIVSRVQERKPQHPSSIKPQHRAQSRTH